MQFRPNPYAWGIPIKEPEKFYGREKEIQTIYSIISQTPPQSILLFGARKMGKTSLLFHLRHEQLFADYYIVYFSWQSVPGYTVEEVFARLLERISYETSMQVKADEGYTGFENYLKKLKQDGKRLVLMFDEFEYAVANQNLDSFFFKFLAEMASTYEVTYIIAYSNALEALCHSPEIANSHFFTNLKHLYLGSFTEEETGKLIIEPSRSVQFDLTDEVEFIIDNAGYFPAYIQMLCYYMLWESRREEALWQFRDAARPLLRYMRDRLAEYYKPELDVLTRLAKGQIKPSDKDMLPVLEQKGYVIRRGGDYRVFSPFWKDILIEAS